MKTQYRWLMVWILLLLLTGCNTPTPSAPIATASPTPEVSIPTGTVIMTTGEYAPYTGEALPKYGAMTEIVSAAFAEMGLTPTYQFFPWKRAEDEVRAGHAFATFPYKMTEERAQEFRFSEPLYVVRAVLVYNKQYHPQGIPFETLADLKPYKIGGLLGNWYESLFAEAGLQTEYVATMDQNIQKLYLGRVDLVAEEEMTCWTTIRQLYPDEVDTFATLAKPLDQNELRLMVSPIYPEADALLQQFNTALQTIRANGIYGEILERHGLIQQ